MGELCMKSFLSACAAFLLATCVTGCSVYMESTRPTPVDLNEYQEGMSRDAVLEKLGAPDTSAVEANGMSCDFYKLYTKGYGAGGKIPIALAEGAADVFTLGLAEIALTPTEGLTKNEKHPVTFCYRGQTLARVTGEGKPNAAPDQNPPSTAASNPAAADQSPAITAASSPAATASPTSGGQGSPPTLVPAANHVGSEEPAAVPAANPQVGDHQYPPITAASIPAAAASPTSGGQASAPSLVPAANHVGSAEPAAVPVANPQVGDQWKSSDHPQ